MAAFYNEIDRLCCDWLQDLIDARLITPGKIDDRPVQELSPDDFRGYERVHFFAGIAGWDHALNLAGWRGPVWTGSCPCQPFSAAGKGKAADDERHLWPAWFSLIRECRPAIVFGEQVEAAIGWGWLDAVFSDLEAEGYACGAAVLGAYSVGAPHIRQRLWFVADANATRCGAGRPSEAGAGRDAAWIEPTRLCADGIMGHAASERLQGPRSEQGKAAAEPCGGQSGLSGHTWACDWLPCTDGKARPVEPIAQQMADGLSRCLGRLRSDQKQKVIDASESSGLGREVLSALRQSNNATTVWQSLGRCIGFSAATLLFACLRQHEGELGAIIHGKTTTSAQEHRESMRDMWPTPRANKRGFPDSHGSWAAPCSSQGWQFSEQCTRQFADAMLPLSHEFASLNGFTGSPLATNVPGRAGRLRAYGNAIVPQVAAEFIKACA